ncbi:MAG: hypothetical protein DWI57_04415 [Chloroflexi bacterium]|nr:MAG: hypothetical protein DWI57_04415 [Chloroflexota bacterium]
MFDSIRINNFRLFSDFQIDDLARVNLFVGLNNSGKSSLLEAIYLLANQGNPSAIFDLLGQRGEVTLPSRDDIRLPNLRSYQISHLFADHQLSYKERIDIRGYNQRTLSVRLYLAEAAQQLELLRQAEDAPIVDRLVIEFGDNHQFEFPVNEQGTINEKLSRSWRPKDSSASPVLSVTTAYLTYEQIASLWDQITLTDKEDKVVSALQILDPDVQRISFTSQRTSNSGILVKLADQATPVPLGSLGDGMRRILAIIASLVNAEKGVLLIDEIDTGLHHTVLNDVWRTIFETAQRLDCQVFASTHSWDCVSSFGLTLQDQPDGTGVLFRLERFPKSMKVIPYTPEELSIAVQRWIEVR